ncbi:MAG: hypothetical protein ACYTFY_19905, partial [Planctomycetota bacterium]
LTVPAGKSIRRLEICSKSPAKAVIKIDNLKLIEIGRGGDKAAEEASLAAGREIKIDTTTGIYGAVKLAENKTVTVKKLLPLDCRLAP